MQRVLPLLVAVAACRGDLPALDRDAPDGDPIVAPSDTATPSDDDTGGLPGTGRDGLFLDTAAERFEVPLAGRWRDADHWAFWESLTADGAPWADQAARWGFDTRQRFGVRVEAGGEPVADATVTLSRGGDVVWSARSDGRGRAEVWGGLFDGRGGPFDLRTQAGSHVLTTLGAHPGGAELRVVPVDDEPRTRPDAVDVVFIVDTRAYASDALSWIEAALPGVMRNLRISVTEADASLRLGVTRFDGRTVASTALSTGVDTTLLKGLRGDRLVDADLGALFDHVEGRDWSPEARARLAVWITAGTDVPEAALPALHDHVRDLAEAGVRLLPVHLDPDPASAFLFRELALATGGTWFFVLDPGRPERTDLVGDYLRDDVLEHVRQEVHHLAGLPAP